MKRLLEILGLADCDYWSDVASCEARSVIDEAPLDLFEDLLTEWRQMTDIQQEHLAYILASGNSEEEDNLIADMLKSENKEVAFRAWEAQQELRGQTKHR